MKNNLRPKIKLWLGNAILNKKNTFYLKFVNLLKLNLDFDVSHIMDHLGIKSENIPTSFILCLSSSSHLYTKHTTIILLCICEEIQRLLQMFISFIFPPIKIHVKTRLFWVFVRMISFFNPTFWIFMWLCYTIRSFIKHNTIQRLLENFYPKCLI